MLVWDTDMSVLVEVEKHYNFLMEVYATFGAAIPSQTTFKVSQPIFIQHKGATFSHTSQDEHIIGIVY